MQFFSCSEQKALEHFSSDRLNGLDNVTAKRNMEVFGKNVLQGARQKTLIKRILESLLEPMMLILLFSLLIILGTNIGKLIKSGDADFSECIGVLTAIVLSVSITVIMEGSSNKAFAALKKMYGSIYVKAIREGKVIALSQEEVVTGDIIVLSAGDKIVADGRLIEAENLSMDESALTGESMPVNKKANVELIESTPLAERVNSVYSGTFVVSGEAKYVVTAVGAKTEIGLVAKDLGGKTESPLNQKLAKLGKTISIIGAIASVIVFLLSVIRLVLTGTFSFSGVQSAFVTSIVLVVAAVPEGLPTIVAVSLALNMIKLAKENALIKKLVATETTGAVSVILSDKTGTLTENKMKVTSICAGDFCHQTDKPAKEIMNQNFCINSTADIIKKGKNYNFIGSVTECALLEYYTKTNKLDYKTLRSAYHVVRKVPFSSDIKVSVAVIDLGGKYRSFIKGSPEAVINAAGLTASQRAEVERTAAFYEKQAKRVIAFAHKDTVNLPSDEEMFLGYNYDGLVAISDPVRSDVKSSVATCKKAGITVKMLTGDNILTATAIAKELGIIDFDSQAISAKQLDNLSEEDLIKMLNRVNVIARSTPATKLKVVNALKKSGEVVAVTGDGINDAPAIKNADVGIVMGSGSEITKEAADIVLLNDSFSTVVKTVSFGRNVYKNLQRFIMFQLSVNLSAVLFIIASLLLGLPSPFNTLQLLWINIIMDGPPALTLGLEAMDYKLMNDKPIDRFSSIVTKKMLVKIIIFGVYIAVVTLLQSLTNFLNVSEGERGAALFTLFILFQLFNAFNSRELGKISVLKDLGKNKPMLYVFAITFVLHVIIVRFFYRPFGLNPLSLLTFIKTLLLASSVIIISELAKLFYRIGEKKISVVIKQKTKKA